MIGATVDGGQNLKLFEYNYLQKITKEGLQSKHNKYSLLQTVGGRSGRLDGMEGDCGKWDIDTGRD